MHRSNPGQQDGPKALQTSQCSVVVLREEIMDYELIIHKVNCDKPMRNN